MLFVEVMMIGRKMGSLRRLGEVAKLNGDLCLLESKMLSGVRSYDSGPTLSTEGKTES